MEVGDGAPWIVSFGLFIVIIYPTRAQANQPLGDVGNPINIQEVHVCTYCSTSL